MVNKLKIVNNPTPLGGVGVFHNIGLTILVIGLVNIYNIVKEGIILNIPITVPIFKIDINSIKIIIFITIVLYIIFSLDTNKLYSPLNSSLSSLKADISQEKKEDTHAVSGGLEKRETIEYKLLIGLGIIGLIMMIISKELIILYLGLELYSFTIYVLILVKESIIIRKISIIYLILSSLASGLLLYTFALIYNKYGVLDLDTLNLIVSTIEDNNRIIMYLILIALLFKLGAIPFSYWLIRVYADLDKRILWYQLAIPKLVFFILLIKFLNVFYDLKVSNNYFIYILFIVSILSLILGAIGGLFQNKDNLLLSYSSILNIGYVLLSLSFLLAYPELDKHIDNFSNLWILYHFFIVYIINLLGLFSVLLLFYQSSLVFNFRTFFTNPFFFISFLIIIFSFIGIPPFSGFFSKFYLLFTLFLSSNDYTTTSFISIASFLLFTFISSFFYFKFLFSSSSSPISSSTSSNTPNVLLKTNGGGEISNASLVLSFVTLITITYPFLLSYIVPFFQEVTNL